MIKTILKEVHCCDKCGKDEHYISKCDNCHSEYCWNCRVGNIVAFPHSIYCEGSGDGSYCTHCVDELKRQKDPRLMAYLAIQDLRGEMKRDADKFKARVDATEAEVKRHNKNR